MTQQPRAVVVLLAPRGAVPSAVRDVLRDWVSLGLVRPFVWVDADDVDPDAPLAAVVGALVLADDAPRVRLQDHLADQRRLDVLRLVALSSVGDREAVVDPDVASDLNVELTGIAPQRVVPLHVVLPRQGAGGWRPDVVLPGFQNLVVAPEDSWSPSPVQPPTVFAVGGDDGEFLAHAASGVASIAGLWTGVTSGPFDGGGQGAEGSLVVVRAFLRRLDASLVAAGLRRALTDVSGGLPQPRSSSGRVEVLQDPGHGARQVMDNLVRRHPTLFEVPAPPPQAARTQVLGAWAAIKMFLSFLVDALRGAPRGLLLHVRGRGGTFVARQVQQALFGEGSRYEVAAAGVNAAGLPAGTSDLAQVADDVRLRLAPLVPTEGTVPDLTGFWGDVAAGAMSLADAGDHGSDVGPVVVGGNARVVRDSAYIAPAPEDAFDLPPAAAARLGRPRVDPYDVRQHDAVARELSQAGGDTTELERWRQRTTGAYTGMLGERLAMEVDRRRQALSDLLGVLRAAPAGDGQDGVQGGLLSGRSTLLRTLVGIVVLLVLGLVAHRYAVRRHDLLSTGDLVKVLLVALLVWLVVQTVVLVKEFQRVFAVMNARGGAEDALEAASRQVPVVAAALHLSTTMYEQYLGWAPVLGRFLRTPFGPPEQPPVPARLHGLLPRAVGFGVADSDEERLAEVAHELGGAVFDRGWLQPLWEAFLADAPRRLGSSGLALRDDPRLLLADEGDPEGRLRRWSAQVVRDGVAGGAGDALWRRAHSALLARGAARLSDQLFARVEVQAQQARRVSEQSGRDFFATLTDALGDLEGHYFSLDLFTASASTQDHHRVRRTVALGRPDVAALGDTRVSERITWVEPDAGSTSLDQFMVVVQTTAAVHATELELSAPRPVRRAAQQRPPDLRDDDLV